MTLICNENDMLRLLAEMGSDCLNEHDLTRIAALIPEPIRQNVWGDSTLHSLEKIRASHESEVHIKIKVLAFNCVAEFNTFGSDSAPLPACVALALDYIHEKIRGQKAIVNEKLSRVLKEKAILKDQIAALEAEEEKLRAQYKSE